MRVGFGLRLLASLIDALCHSIITGGVMVFSILMLIRNPALAAQLKHLTAGSQQEFLAAMQSGAMATKFILLFGVVPVVLELTYWSTEVLFSASPGKLMLGLRIGDESGSSASTQALLLRYVCKQSPMIVALLCIASGMAVFGLVSALLNFILFVGCFMTLAASRQALHDRMAMTAVYHRRDMNESAPPKNNNCGSSPQASSSSSNCRAANKLLFD
jgi:uncharacterized RDD family membrane protein YckC